MVEPLQKGSRRLFGTDVPAVTLTGFGPPSLSAPAVGLAGLARPRRGTWRLFLGGDPAGERSSGMTGPASPLHHCLYLSRLEHVCHLPRLLSEATVDSKPFLPQDGRFSPDRWWPILPDR